MGGFPSGQRGQTVNLLRHASVVRIHLRPVEVLDKWINATRVKLKKNILIKQDKEEANNRMYSSMHDILGADVMKELDRINEE